MKAQNLKANNSLLTNLLNERFRVEKRKGKREVQVDPHDFRHIKDEQNGS